jgi:hypothetical protein
MIFPPVSLSLLETDWFLESRCEGFLEKPMRRDVFLLDVTMFCNQGSGVTADVEVVQLLNKNRFAILPAVITSAFAFRNCTTSRQYLTSWSSANKTKSNYQPGLHQSL